jgi:hypothetical protein
MKQQQRGGEAISLLRYVGVLYEALYYATLLHCAVSFRWLHIINKKTVA